MSCIIHIQLVQGTSRKLLQDISLGRCAQHRSRREQCVLQQVIYVNSADYTAWAYRWQCIEHLGSLEAEAPFINEMASRSPKNYQLWNHRRRVAFKMGASHAQQVTSLQLTHT